MELLGRMWASAKVPTSATEPQELLLDLELRELPPARRIGSITLYQIYQEGVNFASHLGFERESLGLPWNC